jgi:hypothetical protein
MKRILLFVVAVMAVSTVLALAQAPALDNATIVSALPANMRDGATVIKWKPDYTYDTLKKGDNGLVCYDRSGFPLQQPFSVECTSMGNLPREAQNLKAEATGDKVKSEAMLDAEEKAGTRIKPEYGSVWYHSAGPSKEQARPHMTIAMPGAKAQSTGLPDKRTNSGVWVMNAGTTTAHLMTPGE